MSTKTDELMRLHDEAVCAWMATQYHGTAQDAKEADAALRSAIQEVVREWISVGDRLPEPNTQCLILWTIGHERRRAIASLSVKWKGIRLWHGHPGSHNDVTHWQPLPEPPEAS